MAITQAQANKNYYNALKKKSKCYNCKKRTTKKRVYCVSCAKLISDRLTIFRLKRTINGQCTKCGLSIKGRFKTCLRCRILQQRYMQVYRESKGK